MAVQARMKVDFVTDFGTHRQVKMSAVTTGDKTSPNYSFSKYTPQADLSMTITNPDAFNQFEVGKTYDLVFSPVEENADA